MIFFRPALPLDCIVQHFLNTIFAMSPKKAGRKMLAMEPDKAEEQGDEGQVEPPRKRRSSKAGEIAVKSEASGTDQSWLAVKREAPPAGEQRRMLAKLHYMKKTGNSSAFDEYNSKDLEGKRAWFYEVYKMDPQLMKYSNVSKSRSTFRTQLCYFFHTYCS